MAKVVEIKETYIKSPSASGDLYTNKGKYELSSTLSQAQLKELFDAGHTSIVLKVEK